MAGNPHVPVRTTSGSESLSFDREEDYKRWQKNRDKSDKMIGLLVWMIVMILATFAGFGIGYACKYWV